MVIVRLQRVARDLMLDIGVGPWRQAYRANRLADCARVPLAVNLATRRVWDLLSTPASDRIAWTERRSSIPPGEPSIRRVH